jgi:tetratricopeptide (TPR) repeat protein
MIGTTLLAIGLLVAPPQDASALLADDLLFAENLALNRNYDLAIKVVEIALRSIERLNDSDLEGEASLTTARIYKRQAENTADPVERLDIMTVAVQALTDWTNPGTPYAYHDRFVDALEDLAGLLRERGIFYARMADEGQDEYTEKAATDFERADSVYVTLRSEAETIASQFEELEQTDQATLMRNRAVYTLYYRGLNRIEWAEVSEDPSHQLEQAETQLEDFQWEIDGQPLIVFKAMYEQARVYQKLSHILSDEDERESYAADARDVLASVVEQVDASYWDYIDEFSAVARSQVAGLLDRTWGYQASIEAEAGNMAAAEAFIDTLIAEHEEKNVAIGRAGFAALLDWARTLESLGKASQATEIVKIVTDSGQGTPEGKQAEIMLANLVAGGGVQSAAVLLQAARGNRSEKNYADAAYNYARAATSLSTEEERREMGYEAWMGAGDSFRQLGRHLEAAVAYEQALLLGQSFDAALDDLEAAAKKMYDSFDLRFKESGDAYDKALRTQASERLVAMEGIELDLAFMSAKEAFDELASDDTQGFLAVKAELEAVPSASPNYERALMYIARCLAGAGRSQEAVDAFTQLEDRADDATFEPSNATGRNRREVAMAQAHYYHAGLLLQDDIGLPTEALDVLADFEEIFAGQEGIHALVKFKRVEAHAQLGAVDDVELAVQELIDFGARSAIVASAAYKSAKTIESASRLQREQGNADEARQLLSRAADSMWLYAEQSDYDSTVNMLGTGEWYLEALQPADAQTVFEKSVEVIAKSSDAADKALTERAKIGLATALDAQRDFGRSRTIWKELHSLNPRSTKIRRGAARCYGGWLEVGDDGQITEVRGSGDYQDALTIWTELVRGLNVQAKYTGPWWEAKLSAILALYQMRELKPDSAAGCRKVLDSIKLSQPNYDVDTVKQLAPELQYEPLYRDFFRYIDRNLP